MTALAILVLVAIPPVWAIILGDPDGRGRWWEPGVVMLKEMALFAGVAAVVLAACWALGVLFGG